MMRPAVLWSALLLFSSTGAAQAEKCKPSNPPDAWSAQGAATPIAATVDPAAIPRLNLVVFRHAEKPLRDDGLMAEDGNLGAEAEQRLARLPEQLLKDFGWIPGRVRLENEKGRTFELFFKQLDPIADLPK
mgnify:CR=1 FL=1